MQDHHNSKRARPSTHKRFTIFMLTAAYIVSCNGAEFSDTSASRSKVIKSPNDENSPNSVINEVSTTGKKAVNGFELTIETYDEKETKEQVQELLFVLDNSASMRDDIDRFKAGISTLFNGLKDGGVKFRTRMVTLDQFIQQTRPVDGIYMPYGITSSGPPNWDRTNLLSDNKTTMNSIYESVKVFEDTLGAQPVIDRLTEISQKFSLFDNEPGLCTAADYLTWLKKHPSRASISPSSAVHVVIVSDEDNARNMQTRDRNTYQLLKTEPLRCFSEKRAATCQDQKYNRLVSTGPIYGYSYQTTGTQYQYSGTYSKRSRCYDQGFSDDKTAVSLKNYISNKAWTKPTYTCNKNVLVPKFSYKLNGVAGTSSTSKANSKSCREPQSYLCQDAKTFQTCTAGTPSSAVWNVQKVAAPISTIRCEEPKSSVCWQLLDGQGFWTPMTTRASALSVMSALGNDKCKEFSDYSVVELSSAASKLPGISSCSSYSCVAGTEAASLTRAAAISFMASGQCSPENLATAPRKDYPSNASESTLALAECYPYTDNTDISTYRTDTFTQVFAEDRSTYNSCSDSPTGSKTISNAHVAVRDSANYSALKSISIVAQPAGSILSDVAASYVVANDICPANIPPSIPSGVSVVDSGNISPISQANVPYNFVSAIVMTTAAVQTKLASALTFARIVLDKTPDQTTVPTGIVTTFSGANETYGFQKYPANDPKRLLTSFTEKLYQYENEVDTGSLSLPPSDATHRPAGWKYVEQKSYQTDGRYSECVDVPGSAVERIVQATPDDVHQFMKDEHTSTPITWHSIVFNKDKCPANNEGASNGEDYLNMTEKTNGVSQAICTDNFEGFFKSLYANVIHQVVVKYTIPDARIGQNPIRVFNESTQSELARGKDYVIEGNQMVFDPKKVNKGNFVTVEY